MTGEHRVTMVLTPRYSDGSGAPRTTIGTPAECAEAFKKLVPNGDTLRKGYTLDVQFFPAPS